jgi:hypothetical protein
VWNSVPSKLTDPGGFLSAVLQRVQPERDERGGTIAAGHAEHAAFLAQRIAVFGRGFERIGSQHGEGAHMTAGGHIGAQSGFVAHLS